MRCRFLSQRFDNEEREGWSRFVVPLAGDARWVREGAAISTANFITIGCCSENPARNWPGGATTPPDPHEAPGVHCLRGGVLP